MAHSITGDAVPQVSVSSKAMVVPAQPSLRHNFFLSCLDLIWRRLPYNQRLLFYESPSPEDGGRGGQAAAVMEKLRSSLALCLVHYHPWCGRLAEGAEPPHRLFIDCCDAGVEFVEAYSHLPLSLLARDGFQMKPLFQELCQQPDHKGDSLFSSPLLSIQATLFSDGGLALGIAFSHIVADGQSLWNFMFSWGECARAMPLSSPPLLNRERLAVLEPSLDMATWSAKLQVKEEDKEVEEKAESIVQKDSTAGCNDSVGGDKKAEPLVQCMFHLTASAIRKLKSEAGDGHTSFQVICAHFWKRVAVARAHSTCDPTYFYVPVNCRTRMTPPLPSTYFGNVIAFDVILSTVGAIRRETLCATACRISDTVAKITDAFLLGFMHWLETHNHNLAEAYSSLPPLGKGHNVASSPWFPAYQVDFGWGKPVAARSVYVRGDGELVLFGGHPRSMQGDVEICTALQESVLRRLLKDPEFLARPPSSPFANG